MGALVERIGRPSAVGNRILWVHAFDYAARVLRGDAELPWLRAAELADVLAKAHRLLGGAVIAVPVARVVEAWLASADPAVAEVSGKRRPTATLKALLAAEPLREKLREILRAVAGCAGTDPVTLVLPGPGRWVAEAHAGVNRTELPVVDEEMADAASVYLADFLRAFAECGVAGVLLCDGAEFASDAVYQPVLNICRHYRWDVGLLTDGGGRAATVAPFDFRIVREAGLGGVVGVAVPANFWAGGAPPVLSESSFYFVEVPADSVPETLLDRLAVLRGA